MYLNTQITEKLNMRWALGIFYFHSEAERLKYSHSFICTNLDGWKQKLVFEYLPQYFGISEYTIVNTAVYYCFFFNHKFNRQV